MNSHVSDHVDNNNNNKNSRFRSDESDGLVQVEQGGNKNETGYSEAALKMMVCRNFYFLYFVEFYYFRFTIFVLIFCIVSFVIVATEKKRQHHPVLFTVDSMSISNLNPCLCNGRQNLCEGVGIFFIV